MDAMELRGFASQSHMVPPRDLTDPLGKALMDTLQNGSDALKEYVNERTATLNGDSTTLAKELYEKRWGPTKVPIYNVILVLLHLSPENTDKILETTRYLSEEVKVPVDGTDVTGASALYWAISTKPFTETALAQILFDAGASVNQKTRFNSTCASEIGQVDFTADTRRNEDMLRWYIEHGGDLDAKDNDGMNVKMLVEMMNKKVPGLEKVVKKGRSKRVPGVCENCGRKPLGEKVLLTCARCKNVRYCTQECQKVDWKGHKKNCKAPA